MTEASLNLLKQGAASLGIALDDAQIRRFDVYGEMLKDWNTRINLTAIVDDEEIAMKHFVDSLTLLPHLPEGATVADIGTGAGFPGIPCAIARPDIRLTLVDSLDKRVKFLAAVTEALGFTPKQARALHFRAEDFGREPAHRDAYRIATARAVAGMPVLCEYCMPAVAPGGAFVALKGPGGADEAESAEKAVKVLSGRIAEVKEFRLPNTDMDRTIIVVEKVGRTPAAYPRKSGTPAKKPLV